MKKSLIALAVLSAAGVASAQSSVTLFGVVDACYTYGSGSANNISRVGNSCLNSSRLGFRGTEDLGGGLSASFWLEAGVNNDNGTGTASSAANRTLGAAEPAVRTGSQGLTFNRRSTVSLAGKGWGEIRLGRDYTPTFWNETVFDPFGTNGVGTSLLSSIRNATGPVAGSTQARFNVSGIRASNSIGYFLPGDLGGFYGQIQFALGETASDAGATRRDGDSYSARFGYAQGPLNAALAFGKAKNSVIGDDSMTNLGASYNFGVATGMFNYSRDKITLAGVSTTLSGWLLGASVPMGAGEIRASYARSKSSAAGTDSTNQFALGYVHNLSKRTALYATYARVSNGNWTNLGLNGATTGFSTNSSGYDLGIRHSF